MNDKAAPPAAGDRLAKVIARAGLCSRRDAERWIAEGRVAVDGKVIRTPAFNVTGAETVLVDGNPLASRSATRVWLYHKPPGLVVTQSDPEGRPTIFAALEKTGLPRVLSVGRLDINTEGLLLLTNDGGLKRVLELPATGWLRKYRVRVFGEVTQATLDILKEGMTVDGMKYGPIEATLERVQGRNAWLVVALREGKNREIKNVLGALGLQVNRLIRISFGPFQLGDLPVGAVSTVKSAMLKDQLGTRLAAQAGVDFDAPMPEAVVPAVANPNARLRKRSPAPQTAAPRPRGRTAEPVFAKKRAHGGVPGRPGRDARPTRDRRDDAPPETRKIHFDDGRDAVPFEPTVRPKRDSGQPGRKPFGDRSERRDRPERPEREDRPSSGKPRFAGSGRPPRSKSDDRRAPPRRGPSAAGPRKGPPRPRGPK